MTKSLGPKADWYKATGHWTETVVGDEATFKIEDEVN